MDADQQIYLRAYYNATWSMQTYDHGQCIEQERRQLFRVYHLKLK